MAAAAEPGTPSAGRPGPNHGLRIFLLWLPAALAADLVIWFVWGPHLPPGAMSTSAASQQFDLTVLAVMAAPVMLGVLIYAGYAMIIWRARGEDERDGPPIEGNTKVQVSWIAISSALVLFLAVFGTYQLVTPPALGPGRGRHPSGSRMASLWWCR
jgi:cytochrome c oxidase subunit II